MSIAFDIGHKKVTFMRDTHWLWNCGVVIICVILTLLFFTRPFDGNADFYHHITAGRQLVTTHIFPYTDSITHTELGKPWVHYTWLSSVILYILFDRFGTASITVLFALLGFLTLYLLSKLLREYNVRPFPTILTIGIVTPLLSIRWPHRPEVFMYPLVVLLLYTIKRSDQNQRLYWYMPLIILLWANLYGSSAFVGCALILCALLTQSFVKKTLFPTGFIAWALSLIAGILTPTGVKSFFYIFVIPRVASYEGEWAGIPDILRLMPTNYLIGAQYGLVTYGLGLLFMLIVWVSTKHLRNTYPFAYLMSFSFIIPIFTFRQVPLAAILTTPLVGLALHSSRRAIPYIIALIYLAVSLYLMMIANPPGITPNQLTPEPLIHVMRSSGISGNALNQVQLGGIIGYSLSPTIRPFIDTRDDLFIHGKAQKDLYDVQLGSADIMPILDTYHIDVVIADLVTDTIPYRTLIYSPDWSIVYLTDRYMVMLRAKLAKRLNLTELTFLDPLSPSGAKPGEEEKARTYYTKVLAEYPNSFHTRVTLGSLLISQREAAAAAQVLTTTSVERGPYRGFFLSELHAQLSIAYALTSSCIESERMLKESGKDIQKTFLVPLIRRIPSRIDKASAWYYLLCQGDQKKASQFFKKFLDNPNITAEEKGKTQRMFLEEQQTHIN